MVDRIGIKMRAKQSLSGKWGIAIGTSIVAALIIGAAGSIVPGIGGIVLTGVMEVGLAIIFLEITRGWQCNFEDLFKGFNNFGTNCLAGVLVGIFTFLWSLLLVIPGIVKGLSYSMTYYILADNPNMSPTDAITASRVMMDGHKADLFVLYLSFLGWFILTGMTFGILAFYVGPYFTATLAGFYESIKDEKKINMNGAAAQGEPQPIL